SPPPGRRSSSRSRRRVGTRRRSSSPCGSRLIADDRAELGRHLDNPLFKWLGPVFGRIETTDWAKIGLESPFPPEWRYDSDLLPQATTDEFIAGVLEKTTREHVLAGWVCGTPAEVAANVNEYVEAGADCVCPMDYLPV